MCSTFPSPFKEADKSVKAATYATIGTLSRSNTYPQPLPTIVVHCTKQDRSGKKTNLEEVIRRLEEARAVMETRSSGTEKYGVLLNNLGQAYLDQYRKSRTSEETLASAMRTFERARSRDASSPGSSTYTTSLIGSATVLWTACELQSQDDSGDLSRLNAAIVFLETALNQNGRDRNMQAECYSHLAL